MRRIGILIALATSLLSATLAASAAASAPPAPTAPRGVLTKVEYNELYASFEALKHLSKTHGTLTYVARHTCAALTDATRLTTAERAECEASIIYSYEFVAFPYALQRCAKRPTAPGRTGCALNATNAFQRSVRAFIRTNAASVSATNPRHFSKRCLAYLVFTPQQARATAALSAGLKRYARAVRSGSAGAVTSAGNRLDSDMVNQRQAMSLNITVNVCRHQ